MSSRSVGQYTFVSEDLLGRGTFGTVYRGKDKAVVIKQLFTKHNLKELLAQLHNLSRSLAPGCGHVQIVDIVDSGQVLWIVSEYCDQGNLETLMVKKRPKLPKQLCLMTNCVRALMNLHSLGIAHGNLKPHNILFQTVGQVNQVKLADAKLPHLLGQGSMTLKMFSAPEQFDKVEVTRPTDVFSLGLIFHAMLSFRGSDEELLALSDAALERDEVRSIGQEMFEARLRGQVMDDVCVIGPLDSKAVQRVKKTVQKMVVYRPSDRADLQTVLQELELISKDQPLPKKKSDEVTIKKTTIPENDNNKETRRKENRLTYEFKVGQVVRLFDDLDLIKSILDEHGLWEDEIESYVSQEGIVTGVRSQSVKVVFMDGSRFYLHPSTLTKATIVKQPNMKMKRLDIVRTVDGLQEKSLKSLQSQRGIEWEDDMKKIFGFRGIIHTVKDNIAHVEFATSVTCKVYVDALAVVNPSEDRFKTDDYVLISVDRQTAIELQTEAGGWIDIMEKCLEEGGQVRRIIHPNKVEVRTQHGKFIWNQKCLRQIIPTDNRKQLNKS